jgi:hypothetical protein
MQLKRMRMITENPISFAHKILEAFRSQELTPEIASKICDMHNIELDKIKKELISSVIKVFE